MSVIFTIIFLSVCNINTIYGAILTDCSVDIYPNGGDTVICDNKCESCNIICDKENVCYKSNGNAITIYSGAYNTNIWCTGPSDACFQSNFYIGTAVIPDGYNISHFDGPHGSVNIYCTGNDKPCFESEIYVSGDYINGTYINADSTEAFKNAYLECELNGGQTCQLDCGMDPKNCEIAKFECYGGDCKCIEEQGCIPVQYGVFS